MKRIRGVLFILLSLAPFYPLLPLPAQKQKIPASHSEIQAMEKEIWILLNEERAFDNLPPLKLSQALSNLARKHSQDIAKTDNLTHRSSTGGKLARRLEKAGIFYLEAGENLAFSQTFMAELINENLIESPEHRENILNSAFQEVGIGIVYKKDKGYYITQDFLRPLIPQTEQDVRKIIQNNINTRRQAHSLPPLKFLKQREYFAQHLSINTSKHLDLPAIPETFGETLVIFLTTSSLSDESAVFKDAENPRYDRAALGIRFTKNQEYPEGAYFLTLMLFASNSKKFDLPEQGILGDSHIRIAIPPRMINPSKIPLSISRQKFGVTSPLIPKFN